MPEKNRGLALAVLCAASLMVVLDSAVVAVALPTIQTDLGFTPGGLTWVVNVYLVAFGGLLLFAGRLGDLAGRRRVFLAGLGLFTAASLAAGLADDAGVLVVARFVQGAGGALASAVVLGMIVTMYPEPRARARAIGVYSFTQAAGASIGLLAGGVLTQTLGWHWTFFVNLPIGVVAFLLALRVVDADRGTGPRAGLDSLGASLVTGGVMLLVLTIVQSGQYGWADARTFGPAAGTVLLLAGFVARQAKAANPLLPLRIFRVRTVTASNVVMVVMVAGALGFQFVTALYLRQVLGLDALRTGFAFLPTPVLIAVASLGLADRLAVRFGPRLLLPTGLLLVAAGLLLLTRVPANGHYVSDVLPALVLFGLGGGLAIPALMGLAMSGAAPDDAGVASGLVNTAQQVGGAIGTAVLASAAATRTSGLVAGGLGERAALAAGFRFGYGISATLVLAAAVLAVALLGLRERRPVPAAVSENEAAESELCVAGQAR